MAQFQLKTKKIEEKEEKKEKKKESLKVIPLRNDRPLEEFELIAESNAIELSIKGYKRIPPVTGTLGYLFRDLNGGNRAVYEFVKSVLPTSNYIGNGNPKRVGSQIEQFAKQVILIWNALDEFSQNRVDVFDHLCDRVNLKRSEFYGIAQKGMFEHYDAISQRMLLESKPEVINASRQFMQKEENFKDRELMSKATGLTKDAPIIGNIDASTKVNNNLTIESNFSSSMKEIDREANFIEGEIIEEPSIKQLGSGNTEFLNTEVKEESEEELLAILRK